MMARVALGAVAPTPIMVPGAAEALIGRPISDETIAAAAQAAHDAATPIDDMRGSVKQRKHLSRVLAQRTLDIAVERARGPTPSGEGTYLVTATLSLGISL